MRRALLGHAPASRGRQPSAQETWIVPVPPCFHPCLHPCPYPCLHPYFALAGQAFTRLFAGGVAGMAAAAVVYPLEVIKTILTAYPEEASGIGEAVEASSPSLP